MNQDSNAIITLCSYLCIPQDAAPLEPREWSQLAQRLIAAGKRPADLFDDSEADLRQQLGLEPDQAKRLLKLLDRNASLTFALKEYTDMGIQTVTRADESYPFLLKKKLGNGCPPIFYCAGDLALLRRPTIGYVGSRSVSMEDLEFTKEAVKKTVSHGYGVVSGGAKGIDTIAGTESLQLGAISVEYLSDSLLKKLNKADTVRSVQDGRLLLLSAVKPDAGFNVGVAMMRNRYVYAQSEGTVVVRSDLNKGGTWTGANENLKNAWCPTLCWDHPYPGNQALLQKGATPIGTDWDGTVTSQPPSQPEPEQMSLFDL